MRQSCRSADPRTHQRSTAAVARWILGSKLCASTAARVLSGSICAVSQNRCGCSFFFGRESIFKTNFQNQFSQWVFGNQPKTDPETGQRTAKTEAKTEAETGQELGVGFAPSSQNQFSNQRDWIANVDRSFLSFVVRACKQKRDMR